MRNIAIILGWNFKLPGKFQHFNVIDEVPKWRKIAEFPKTSVKIKIFETFYEAQIVSRLKEIIQPPPDKSFLRLWNKSFLTEIYRNIQTFVFQVLLGRLEMGQCKYFFWHQPEACLLENLFKAKFLAVLRENIFCNIEWVEVRKMSEDE